MKTETILIDSNKHNIKLIALRVFGVFFIIAAILLFTELSTYENLITEFENHVHRESCYKHMGYYGLPVPYCRFSYFSTGDEYALQMFLETTVVNVLIILGIGAVISVVIFLLLKFNDVTVSDKRIYGKSIFGIPVNLPTDSVTGVVEIQFLKSVVISSSSKKFIFLPLKNSDEICDIINNLLIERQKKEPVSDFVPASDSVPEKKTDTIDALIKLNELLNMGVITQEEFEAKKKQLLDL